VKRSLVYLASPYSHPDPAVRESRFQAACQATSHLMRAGLHVFSPIAHTHPVILAGTLPTGWEFWRAYDEAVLSACRALVVLELDGWEESEGVRGEVEIARQLNLATYHASPAPNGLGRVADLLLHEIPFQADERTIGRLEFANAIANALDARQMAHAAQWVRDVANGVETLNPNASK
jgi:hypothetical protein